MSLARLQELVDRLKNEELVKLESIVVELKSIESKLKEMPSYREITQREIEELAEKIQRVDDQSLRKIQSVLCIKSNTSDTIEVDFAKMTYCQAIRILSIIMNE